MKTITFTVTRVTRNFGGLFNIKTKNSAGASYNAEDVGVMELFTTLEEITEALNEDGYAVLFEIS